MDLKDYTLVELRQLAKENGVKNVSKLKKEELLNLLKSMNNKEENTISTNVSKLHEDNDTELTTQEREEEFNSLGYKLTNSGDRIVEGILEVLPDGYGFLRGENYLSTADNEYI